MHNEVTRETPIVKVHISETFMSGVHAAGLPARAVEDVIRGVLSRGVKFDPYPKEVTAGCGKSVQEWMKSHIAVEWKDAMPAEGVRDAVQVLYLSGDEKEEISEEPTALAGLALESYLLCLRALHYEELGASPERTFELVRLFSRELSEGPGLERVKAFSGRGY